MYSNYWNPLYSGYGFGGYYPLYGYGRPYYPRYNYGGFYFPRYGRSHFRGYPWRSHKRWW